MSFEKRKIDVTFYLQNGQFSPDQPGTSLSANGVTVSGLRVSAVITRGGAINMPSAFVRIYGMTLSQMNQLSTLGKFIRQENQNQIAIKAGTEGHMPVVFVGNILEAWADFGGMPEVVFTVSAVSNIEDNMKPVLPTSYDGPVDVATVMSDLASRGGYQLENSLDTSIMLPSPYYKGTLTAQIAAAAQAAYIEWGFDTKILFIFPMGGARNQEPTTISAANGMVGYPTYTQNGLLISTLYNPAVLAAGWIKVESDVTPAAGKWRVLSLAHELESEMPNGAWFTRMNCITLEHTK